MDPRGIEEGEEPALDDGRSRWRTVERRGMAIGVEAEEASGLVEIEASEMSMRSRLFVIKDAALALSCLAGVAAAWPCSASTTTGCGTVDPVPGTSPPFVAKGNRYRCTAGRSFASSALTKRDLRVCLRFIVDDAPPLFNGQWAMGDKGRSEEDPSIDDALWRRVATRLRLKVRLSP